MNISVTLSPELRLEQALKEAGIVNAATLSRLTVDGTITDADCVYIRWNMAKTLRKLDMSGALFEENKIPKFAFMYCTRLTSFTIPDSVAVI